MLKKLRVLFALFFWLGITLLFLDFTGGLHRYLSWMAKIQLLPAVMAVNLAVIAVLVLLTLLFGRIYCSVICPLGVFQDAVSHVGISGKKQPYGYRREIKWLRYGVWALFVIALIAGIHAFVAILAPYSAYGRMVQSLLQPVYIWFNNIFAHMAERAGSYAFYSKETWFRSLPVLVVSLVTLVIIVVLSFRGGRTYCNSICPVGTTLSFFSRFSMFRPVIDVEKCRNCKACEHKCKAMCIDIDSHRIDYSRCVDCFNCIGECKFDALKYRFAWGRKASGNAPAEPKGADASRRAFIASGAFLAGSAVLHAQKKVDGGLASILEKQEVERDTPITPPGSLSVRDFYRRCTACQLCVAECPNNVLRPSSSLERFMQPEMGYERGFCRPECTRCSQICPSGAIRPIGREEKTQYHIGTARVNPELCISAKGESHCGKCVRMCPVGALSMVQDPETGNRRPVVAEEVCIGCGACEQYCPSRPISAIVVNGRAQHLDV